MKTKMLLFAVMASAGTVLTPPTATAQQILHGHVPEAIARLHLQPIGRLPTTNRLHLAIGLPLRNREALANLLQQLYDPASTNYHEYLTPAQFTERFGPTEADYQKVLQVARTNALEVVSTYTHRELLDVSATVSDIEKAFHVNLRTYQHPTENRQFYAPDVEPSVDANVPILSISGLNNYDLPHPASRRKSSVEVSGAANGTAPGHNLWGKDFRNAYAPSVTLNGSGQYVGLVEFDGYYPSDITNYESLAGLPQVHLTNVMLSGSSGYPDNNTNHVAECSMDIEMVISMATNLTELYVFEGTYFDDILGSMVTNSQIKQFSSSWFGASFDSKGDELLQHMPAQGQTFFQASGDGDAYTQPITGPADDLYVTSVGGTTLTMDSTGTNYGSEKVWNWGFQSPGWGLNGDYTNGTTVGGYWGSGGGVRSSNSIPKWQQGVNLTVVGGSTSNRNIPDVAMNADNVYIVFFNGLKQEGWGGTSLAAPLWAGFTALVNQQASFNGQSSVGFINPQIYAIGEGSSYTTCFHDITTGSNTWSGSPTKFYATNGYDLCTGWGTPNGASLINALTTSITPPPVQPPVLSNPRVTPASGTVSTTFEFLVDYSDPNSLPPASGSPILYLSDSSRYQMTLKSGLTYHCTTTLSTGSYSYQFYAANTLGGVAQTAWYNGPLVYSSGNATIDIIIECSQISPDLILQYSLSSSTGPWTTIPINQDILSPLIVPAGSQIWFRGSVSNANYTYREWEELENGVLIGSGTTSEWTIPLGTATEVGLEVYYNYTPQSYTISGTALLSNGSQVPGGVNLVLTSSQQTMTNNTSNGNWSFSGVLGGVSVTIAPSAAGYEFSPASLVFYDLNSDQPYQVFSAAASDDYAPTTQLTNMPPSVTTNATVAFGWTAQDNVTPTADLQYQYKLDGVDTNWSAWSLATSASYTVSNGCYTFWVRAMDQAGNINQAPNEYTFVVNAAPVVLSAVEINRSVWSSRLTVQMPVGALRPSSNIVIIPAYSGLPDTDLVPVRIHRADQTTPAGANSIVASQLGLPALITKTTNGWLTTLPDNLSPGQTTNYDIVWGKVKYFGWQEDVSVPANFPNGGGVLSAYLDNNLNLWRVAAKDLQYGVIGNAKAWVWMNMGNANGPVINETLLRYTPGHPDDGTTGYQTDYELGSVLKTTPNISLFWLDHKEVYTDLGHITSNYRRYGVQVCSTNGTFLNSQDGIYTNMMLTLPYNTINNSLWFLQDSSTNLYFSAINYAGVSTVPLTQIDSFKQGTSSGFQYPPIVSEGTNAIIIWERWWNNTNGNSRAEINYAVCNQQGQVIKPRTALMTALADNVMENENVGLGEEGLTDNAGKVWFPYVHVLGSTSTNYYVVFNSDGSIWQGPVQTAQERAFNFCDRDGLIWTSEGGQFFVLNPDGTTNVPPRVGAWTPNQPCSGIAASVGNDNYRLYDRWSPQLMSANIPQVDQPTTMEVYDLNIWGNGLHTANVTIQNGTNTIWTQSGQFTGYVDVAVSGAFNAGVNTLTLSQNDFLGGQLLVTFPYSINWLNPIISSSAALLTNSVVVGQNSPSQTLQVWDSGILPLNYRINVNEPWLSVTPTNGTSAGEANSHTVIYGTTSLTAGVYNATITITSSNAINSPQLIPVTLSVIATNSFMTNGLVAYYPFNGNVNDASGNGNDGTLYGASFVTNSIGQIALSFNGINNYVSLANLPTSGSGDFSIFACIETRTTGVRQDIVAYGATNGSTDTALYLFLNGSGKLEFDLAQQIGPTSTTTYNDGSWYDVGIVNTSGSMQLYADGSAVGSPQHMSPNIGIGWQYIGGGYGVDYFNGLIDDVRIYNRALSAAEVQQLDTLEQQEPGLSMGFSGSNLILSYSNGILLQSTNILGPWTTNSTASPVTVAPTNPAMFFQIKQ